MAAPIKRNWDRPDLAGTCVKGECRNERGRTQDGVPSVHCDYHTQEWELRLATLAERHKRTRPTPVAFKPPPPPPMPVLSDAEACFQCHQAPRDWPDRLCEDCRRG